MLIENYPSDLTLIGWLRFIVQPLFNINWKVLFLIIFFIWESYAFSLVLDKKFSIYEITLLYPWFISILIWVSALPVLMIFCLSILLYLATLPLLIKVLVQGIIALLCKVKDGLTDQKRYIMLLTRPKSRPTNVHDAIDLLGSFKTDSIKTQYAHALLSWLPVSKEWHALQEVASKEGDLVRDALFQLSEIWEDSTIND